MNSSLKMKREMVEMIEKDQKNLQEALKKVLPRIDALELKVDSRGNDNKPVYITALLEKGNRGLNALRLDDTGESKLQFVKNPSARDVPLEEYQKVSNRIEEVRKLVTGLLKMIKPLNCYPRKVSKDDLTNKCNAI